MWISSVSIALWPLSAVLSFNVNIVGLRELIVQFVIGVAMLFVTDVYSVSIPPIVSTKCLVVVFFRIHVVLIWKPVLLWQIDYMQPFLPQKEHFCYQNVIGQFKFLLCHKGIFVIGDICSISITWDLTLSYWSLSPWRNCIAWSSCFLLMMMEGILQVHLAWQVQIGSNKKLSRSSRMMCNSMKYLVTERSPWLKEVMSIYKYEMYERSPWEYCALRSSIYQLLCSSILCSAILG